jgi:hypothetical protein
VGFYISLFGKVTFGTPCISVVVVVVVVVVGYLTTLFQ